MTILNRLKGMFVAEAVGVAGPVPGHPPVTGLSLSRHHRGASSRRRPVLRRRWMVLTVFASIVCLQLLITMISIEVMSSVRAYVAGESLYSKAQKDAQFYLVNYAETRDERDFELFAHALEIPLGDRSAREEMQKPNFDEEVARRGYLAGGNHATDIPGAIRLFRWFQATQLMTEAIATWTRGDLLVEDLRSIAWSARKKILAGELNAPEVTSLRAQVTAINRQLTPLEDQFAWQLSDSARLAERLLFWANLASALCLGLGGSAFVRRSNRAQAIAEAEVRRRREALQNILDCAAEGLFGLDTKGRCSFINRSALNMLGFESDSQVLGQSMHALIDPTDAKGMPRKPGRSIVARAALRPREIHRPHEVFWRQDGSSFPVEFWSHPRLQDGRFDGAVATFVDITERVKMQEALRRGEVRMTGLIDAVNDGVIAFGTDHRIVLFNRAAERLFRVSAKDALGSKVRRFIRSEWLAKADQENSPASPGSIGTERVRELTARTADGHRLALEASVSVLDTDEERLTTMVLRDVTELQIARKELEAVQALRAANQAKSDFLSRMSHELRTPLNAVLGFSQLMRLDRRRPPAPEHVHQLKLIESAGSHLLELVNDVLDLSQVESGQMTVALIPTNVRAAIGEALSMVAPLARKGNVRTWVAGNAGDLVTRGLDDEEDAAVLADPLRLRQILVNVLSNAIKYNRPRGEVRISWQVMEGRCLFSVEDDGIGIESEQLGRLFQPFNRLGAERSTVEGTGIGLVLSRRLAELMGGELRVESTVDVGTKVTLSLAWAESVGSEEVPLLPPSQHGDLEPTQHILYAEDNEVNVEIVRQLMTFRPSVKFSTASNGAEAFRMAKTAPPDLMLVDMNLGDMSGQELANALKSDAATAGIRLVALSADALPQQIKDALANGFEAYLTKPLEFRDLLNVVDGRPARRSRR